MNTRPAKMTNKISPNGKIRAQVLTDLRFFCALTGTASLAFSRGALYFVGNAGVVVDFFYALKLT